MKDVLALLKKHSVSEYEVVIWLTAALEYQVGEEDYTERLDGLRKELNVLSWHV